MKKNWKIYAAGILIAEAVGALSAWLSRSGMEAYSATVTQPALTPPTWLFPVAWTVLYALMGIGAARVWLAPDTPERRRGLNLFVAQLIVNFFWSLIFFNLQAFGFALIWLLLLLGLVLWMTVEFTRTDRLAGLLQLPYLLWLAFAGYLTFMVWMLNR